MSKDVRKALMIAKGQVSSGYLPPGDPQREANFARHMEGSKAPKELYHLSKGPIPETFDSKLAAHSNRENLSPFGFHFGTKEQAAFRGSQDDFSPYVKQGPSTGKFHVSIRKPFKTTHMGSTYVDHLADTMMDANLIKPEEYDEMRAKAFDDSEIAPELKGVLKRKGYDGLVYKNEREGEGLSWVPFSGTQIKSATGNTGTFDPSDPDITKAEGGEVDVQYDNPGGNWLKHQRENAEATVQKRGNIGAAGALTAWSKPVHVDPAKLSKIPGSMNEQPEPGNAKYDALHKSMSAEGYSNKSPLLVGINHRGEPHIIEGNHRAAVARDLGVKSIPVEFRWFAGGEQADGFKPEHIKSLMPDITKAEGGKVKSRHPALSIPGFHVREEIHGTPIFTGGRNAN